jgi:hypothetical protein
MGRERQIFIPQPGADPTTRGNAAFTAGANNGEAINAAQIGPAAPAVQTGAVTLTPRVSGKFRLTASVSGVTAADADVTGTFRANAAALNNTMPPLAVVTSGGATHRFALDMEVITRAYALGTPVAFDLNIASTQNITIAIGQATFTAEELPA